MCQPDLERQIILRDHFEPVTKEREAQQAEQVQALLNIKLPEQRTEGWYKMRESFITASDWGKVLGINSHGNSVKSIILSKCGVRRGFSPKSGALEWGVRYEEVATRLYEKRRGVNIIEFGCIPHPTISFLGASPDGITEEGIMLEIKCPYSRVINGTVPPQYWAQVQGQLEVCELDMCDYLECKLVEYSGVEEYLADDFEEKGCVCCFERKDGSWMYEYSDFGIDREEHEAWIEEVITKRVVNEWMKYKWCKYWKCDTFSVVRIYRDEVWFRERALPVLKSFWEEEVMPCKKNGYAHLIPKKEELKTNAAKQLTDVELIKDCDKNDVAVKIYLNPRILIGNYPFPLDGTQYDLTDDVIGYHDDDYKTKEEVEKEGKDLKKSRSGGFGDVLMMYQDDIGDDIGDDYDDYDDMDGLDLRGKFMFGGGSSGGSGSSGSSRGSGKGVKNDKNKSKKVKVKREGFLKSKRFPFV